MKPPRSNFEVHFTPVATELGRLVFSWNELHEHLGELFEAVIRPRNHGTALAAWRVTESDRMQRKMLEYAVLASKWESTKSRPSTQQDILWLVSKADKLADQRNDAIHAPYAILTESNKTTKIVPLDFFGNPRAKKLSGKPLKDEINFYHRRAQTLSAYAVALATAVREDHIPWPHKPKLPER